MILRLKLDHDIEAKTGRLDNLKGNERNRDFLGRKKEEPWVFTTIAFLSI